MDIRKWFTSPKGAISTVKKTQEKKESTAVTEKSAKAKKKKRAVLDSDSDEDPLPKTKKPSPKRRKESPRKKQRSLHKDDESSGEDPVSSKKKFTALKKKMKILSDEEFIGDSDTDIFQNKVATTKKVPNQKKPSLPVQVKNDDAKTLKHTTVAAFFGSTPVERHSKNKKVKKDVERNHEDHDFSKTLRQLDEKNSLTQSENIAEVEKEIEELETKTEKTALKKSPRRTHQKKNSVEVSNLKKSPVYVDSKNDDEGFKGQSKFRESTSKKSPKKESSKKNPIEEPKQETVEGTSAKKKGSYLYRSYLEREGPRALGSKEIPEGEEGCLQGMTFIITGVLESIERDDAKSLIEKYGGKVMSTLSKNTKYIVIGRDAGSSKLEKAEKFGTIQLDEDGLFDLIRTTRGRGSKVKKIEKNIKGNADKNICASKNNELIRNEESTDLPFPDKKIKKENSSTGKKEEEDISDSSQSHKADEKSKLFVVKESSDTPEIHLATKSPSISTFEMWVDKYKPTSVKQIIGQQGDKSNAKKLNIWLSNWYKRNQSSRKPAPSGRWNSNDDGSGFKAALLSGPPGVGKTTTAQLVCKECGFDYFELNASDTRSKKNLQQVVSQLLGNQTLADCFKAGNTSGVVTKKHAVIMDEVDGMAGNEDRGGIQELIAFIKASKVPIICICNDRNHPKIRSLANYCFDLRFQRPRVEQIKAAMMSVAFKENIKITPNVLQDIIIGTNQDIRQVLHNLSLWCSKEKGLTIEQAKQDIGKGTKNIKLGPFDVLREVFAIGNNPKATIHDKSDLFFHDYSIAPLFVQENYVHVHPSAAQGNKLKHLQLLSEAANSICIGDLIDKQIRSRSSWNLLPTQAIFASVVPGELMTGHLKQMISFPQWLGKNSSRNHMDRILQELHMHMRMKITGNKTDVVLEYLPLLKQALTKPLIDNELEGIPETVKTMNSYCLLREDFDSVLELSLWPNQVDPRSKINTKVKSAFTRTYNKECTQNPYTVKSVKKKRGSAKAQEGELGEDEEDNYVSEEEEDNDKLENDAMIKVKKPTKKAAVDDSESTSSKKGGKAVASKRGRQKK